MYPIQGTGTILIWRLLDVPYTRYRNKLHCNICSYSYIYFSIPKIKNDMYYQNITEQIIQNDTCKR
jgi:hypothetical protein